MENKKIWKERINYSIEGKYYCGHSVNMPLVIQAESMDDLKQKTRDLVKIYINDLQKILDNDSFEYTEESPLISNAATE